MGTRASVWCYGATCVLRLRRVSALVPLSLLFALWLAGSSGAIAANEPTLVMNFSTLSTSSGVAISKGILYFAASSGSTGN